MEETNKKIYELGYHVLPTVSEEELAKVVESIKGSIAKADGAVIADQYPASIKLAYDIVKEIDNKNRSFDSAFFGWVKFEMEGAKLADFENGLKKNMNLLRFLLIKTVRESTLATIKLAQKHTGRRPVSAPEQAVEMDAAAVDKKIDEMIEVDTSVGDLK